ncbi:melanoma antigen preferentially expressed in tumors-like [Erinaceus europaeus]|uniref:Melanoma antigen preferentially expressed in tumors-like n=1 Tax=Erinaceus europaeus TaxID=9365 RepID=A0A1S3AMK2_ERIEU|nr:melanoma antigen preferentially expressed in tumors-like [Erinaceus europaeus]
MNMDQKATATLLELAAKSLLTNEPAAINALEELPRDIFVTLFNVAFLGGHKKMLKSIVTLWPFHCLHIGTLFIEESYNELLEAMVDGLQMRPAQKSPYWRTKLRILDLRQDPDCETVCSDRTTYPFCFQSCIHSNHSILKIEETQHNSSCPGVADSESRPPVDWEPIEILVDITFDGSLKEMKFISCLLSKVEHSFGSLHLCCRNLQIDNISIHKNSLQFLDVGCIEHLEVNKIQLKEITSFGDQMIHVDSLSLSNISFKTYKGRNFRTFLTWLRRLNNLQELNLSFVCIRDQMSRLLRFLPLQLDTLCLSFCDLSQRDIIVLSQSSKISQIKLLNLSNNQIFWDVYEPFLTLLEKVSSTLQHLELNNCLLTDSTLSAIFPSLSCCYHLRVLSFAFNPITMPALMDFLQNLATMVDLKYVIYPVPVHCYEHWNINGNLDQQKLAEVQAQLNVMLQAVHREDMNWSACSE